MKRIIYIALGFINVALGTIGIFVPVMPTTVFLLMAAWFFSKSSPKFLFWLENNRFLGKYISNYRSGRGMEIKDKIFTLVLLWVGLGVSEFLVHKLWVQIMLGLIGMAVTIHVLYINTHRPELVKSPEKDENTQNSSAEVPLPQD